MKREVFKMMWQLIKTGLNKSEALKKAWNVVKELSKKAFSNINKVDEILNNLKTKERNNLEEKLETKEVLINGLFRVTEYSGKGKFTTSNWTVWAKYGKVRIYFDRLLDGVTIENSYIAL